MKKVPHHNDTDKIKHVGNVTIWPGQTREVDESLLGPAKKTEADADRIITPGEVIALLLAHKIADLVQVLPELSDDELNALEIAEREKRTPRIGALGAIADERLRRASNKVDGDPEADKFAELVKTMGDDELNAQDYPENQVLQAIVDEEKQHRAIAVFKAEFAQFDAADLEELKGTYEDQPDYLAAIDELIAAKGNE